MFQEIKDWFRNARLPEWSIRSLAVLPIGMGWFLNTFMGIPALEVSGAVLLAAIILTVAIPAIENLFFYLLAVSVMASLAFMYFPVAYLSYLGYPALAIIGLLTAIPGEKALRKYILSRYENNENPLVAHIAERIDSNALKGDMWQLRALNMMRSGRREDLVLLVNQKRPEIFEDLMQRAFGDSDRYSVQREIVRNLGYLRDGKELLKAYEGVAVIADEIRADGKLLSSDMVAAQVKILNDALQTLDGMARGVMENARLEKEERLKGIVKKMSGE